MLTLREDELNLIYDYLHSTTDYNEFRNDGKTIYAADVDRDTGEMYGSSSYDINDTYDKAYYQVHGMYPVN